MPFAFFHLQESDIFGLCAREKGIDSIQFEPTQGHTPIGTFGLPGLTEIVLVNIDGDKTCGVEDPRNTPLRCGHGCLGGGAGINQRTETLEGGAGMSTK